MLGVFSAGFHRSPAVFQRMRTRRSNAQASALRARFMRLKPSRSSSSVMMSGGATCRMQFRKSEIRPSSSIACLNAAILASLGPPPCTARNPR